MNTYNLNLSSTTTNLSATYDTIELFDTTRLSLNLSNVDTQIFPNYVAIRWGDETPLEEPEITLFRDYRSESIFPEIKKHASPPFFDVLYNHIFIPSSTALKKSMTMRVNIGYINGHTTYFTIPINVRTGSYYEDIEDLELLSVSLLDTSDNKSKFTYLTKKDNHILQNHNDNEIVYNLLGPDPLSSYEDTGHNGVNTIWRIISSTADPIGSQAAFKFIGDVTAESGVWQTDWWGYANRDILNFSGVSYFAEGFRSQNNITLVTPKHGILVNHFADDPAVDDTAYFYDHTTGNSVLAIVEATTQVTGTHPNMDLRVVRFDRDLTTALTSAGGAGSIKPYYLPQFDNEVPDFTFPIVYQAGNYVFDSDRHAGLGIIGGGSHTNVIGTTDGKYDQYTGLYIGSKDLGRISALFSSSFFGLSNLANGDSGSPIFILYNNEILLASLFQSVGIGGYGAGLNLGNPYINANITSAINTVGNSEGYTLSTVRLS